MYCPVYRMVPVKQHMMISVCVCVCVCGGGGVTEWR